MKRPLAGTVLVYAAGIWVGSFLPVDWPVLAGLVGLLLGMFGAAHYAAAGSRPGSRWEPRAPWVLWLLVFVTGSLVYRVTADHDPSHALDRFLEGQPRQVTLRGVVVSDASGQASFRLETEAVHDAGRWHPVAGRVFVFLRQRTETTDDRVRLRYGDRIECSMFLRPPRPPRNPGVFDFRAWLARHRIYLVGSVGETDHCRVLAPDQANWLRGLSLRLRERFAAALRAGLEDAPDRAGVMAGMVIGERAEIPPETYAAFQHTGAFHVFAISGLHVGLVTFLVLVALRLVRVPRRWCGLVAIPLMVLYVFATGARPGAVRALVMATVFLLGGALVRPTNLPNTTAVAALVILAIDPAQLFDGGFILSFTVVTVLVLLAPVFAGRLETWTAPNPLKPAALVPAWRKHPYYLAALRWSNNLVAGSVAAWIGLVPLMAIYFNLFTPVSILANLVAVPLLGGVIALGMLSILVYPAWAGLAEIFNNANYLLLGALEGAVQWLGQVPGGHLFVQAPPAWWAALYYGGLVIVLLPAIDRPWRRRLLLVGAPLVGLAGVLAPDREPTTVVTVLDLYRGQAVFVNVAGQQEDFLVDTGDDRGADRIVVPFLRSRGVDRLERLIITRGTKTHLGGFEVLADRIPIGQLLDNGLPVRSTYYERYRQRLAAADREPGVLRAGDRWQTTAGLAVEVLHPPPGWNHPRSADNALVFVLEQHGRRVLFLPAAGETVERALLARAPDSLRADVIVRGGHGSEPSCTEALLDAVNPAAVILAGPGDARRFGVRDPAAPSLGERLQARSIRVYRTADQGAIRIRLNARGYSIEPWL